MLHVDCQGMNPTQIARARYRVIFAKDAQELEAKLNDTNFVPSEYAITHLTFNSGRAEYLVILERDWVFISEGYPLDDLRRSQLV